MQSYNNLVNYDYFCPRIAQIFYNMQKVIISLLLILECTGIQAQSNLAGRIYYNPNILSGKMKELSQEVNKNMADAKAQAIKEEEQNQSANQAEKPFPERHPGRRSIFAHICSLFELQI